MADARSIEFETEQRRGVGTRFVCDTRVGPLRIDDTLTVTEWDPPHDGDPSRRRRSGTGVFTSTADRPGAHRADLDRGAALPVVVGGRRRRVRRAAVLRRIWAGNLERPRALRRRAKQSGSSRSGGADHDHDERRSPPRGDGGHRHPGAGVEHELLTVGERVGDDQRREQRRRHQRQAALDGGGSGREPITTTPSTLNA